MTVIECWNCPKEFIKFRFKNPFQNTCRNCIMKASHISEKVKHRLLSKSKMLDL